MKYFSMFSGIDGFELGIYLAQPSWECIGYSEIDKHAINIYQTHFTHKNYGNATTIDTRELPDFDLLVGGFPCQAFSIAGKRKGFDEARGTLFFEIARICADKRPRYLVLENVKGLLSHDSGKTFQTILRVLTELGYIVEWQVLNSKDFGVPQNRERIFIIGYFRGERRPKVFPVQRGSNQALKELTVNTNEANRIYSASGISRTIKNGGGGGAKTGLYIVGDTRMPTFIDLSTKEAKLTREARTLQARYAKGHTNRTAENSGVAIPVLTPDRINKRQNGRRFKNNGDPAFTLTGQDKHGVAIYQLPRGKNSGGLKDVAPTLTQGNYSHNNLAIENLKIRRLTPKECERLQGFPDDWTKGISDTQRYKCLGNAVTVNVIQYIFNNLKVT